MTEFCFYLRTKLSSNSSETPVSTGTGYSGYLDSKSENLINLYDFNFLPIPQSRNKLENKQSLEISLGEEKVQPESDENDIEATNEQVNTNMIIFNYIRNQKYVF